RCGARGTRRHTAASQAKGTGSASVIPVATSAVQQAHPADAARGERDRWHFEGWIYPDSFPDLEGGAADGQAVRPPSCVLLREATQGCCSNRGSNQAMTFGFTNIQVHTADRPSTEVRAALVEAVRQFFLDRSFVQVTDCAEADRTIVIAPASPTA